MLLSSTSVGAVNSVWSILFETSGGERHPIKLIQEARYLSEVQQMTVRSRRSAASRQRAGKVKWAAASGLASSWSIILEYLKI